MPAIAAIGLIFPVALAIYTIQSIGKKKQQSSLYEDRLAENDANLSLSDMSRRPNRKKYMNLKKPESG